MTENGTAILCSVDTSSSTLRLVVVTATTVLGTPGDLRITKALIGDVVRKVQNDSPTGLSPQIMVGNIDQLTQAFREGLERTVTVMLSGEDRHLVGINEQQAWLRDRVPDENTPPLEAGKRITKK